ncbi:Thrombospondin type-1 domain-containing protein 4 [Bagarius yarrelli]|uniref:Thrombospondin type-1 domain-containing protein 4 n=1 Tax=Bagarius yarrelli TaxID=175774 RepID=A0A556TQK7_BAGYA|nr:Thrombospondin type-1 domain-containing protein 4 [Bagarius yarrelli]
MHKQTREPKENPFYIHTHETTLENNSESPGSNEAVLQDQVSPRPMVEPQTLDTDSSGSWGSWGSWGECSRSCGGGVQEQSRQCLRTYSSPPTEYSSRQGPHTGHQDPNIVISALKPSVPVHHGNNRPLPESQGSQQGTSRGVKRKQQSEARLGRRRGSSTRIVPGMYGFGKMPYIVSSQRDFGQTSYHQRQSRSPTDNRYNSYRHQHKKYRNTQQYSSQNTHHGMSQSASWVPLHQPGTGLQSAVKPHHTGTLTSGFSQASVPGRPQNPLPLPASSCLGDASQYKMCNVNSCPPASRNIRDIQCSSYNNHPFMGRLYEWEPFNEVPGDQICELNCRAIGYRFYVKQSDRVTDGTPCGQNETAICVAGKCQSPGCDELLGSGKVLDKCGVCGGDNTACQLVSGLFQHSLPKVGYHKIIEIPQGATKINVTEMIKSQNYLALRSHSGRSIINGNWAIDRPGKYEGGGTMFTYRRPNEISSTAGESFLAEGPTNEILDVYMIYQQPNPRVHYEYILPSDNSVNTATNTGEVYTVSSGTRYDHYGRRTNQNGHERTDGHKTSPDIPETQVPPHRHKEHNWKLTGTTDCSASCGRGQNQTHFSWDIGEWSECSKTCGLGMQHRQILCRQFYINRTLTVPAKRCEHLERPESSSTCQLKICSEWQIRSEWSSCSMPCGVGQRTREVRCVSNVGDFVEDEECNMNLRPSDIENCDMGPCAKSWFYTDWGEQCSAECGFGVQSRSVVCLSNLVSSVPLEGCGNERPPQVQPCNHGPCESHTDWFTGPWGQCSAMCGTGSQQRTVVCMMKSDESYVAMPPYECSSLDKPLSQQSCQSKTCGAKWMHVDKYVITGGGGYFGFRLACTLSKKSARVILFDVGAPAEKLPRGVEFIQGDVRDLAQVENALRGGDCVFHVASYGMSGREQLNWKLIEEVNIQGTENVIQACINLNVPRLVYTSTFNVVFGGQVIKKGDETLPYLPLHLHPDHYSRTKSVAEVCVLKANGMPLADEGGVLRTCALRPAGIYGPGEQRHLPRIVKYLESGLFRFVYGDPESLVEFVHVENLVSAHELAAEALTDKREHRAAGQAYFISDGRPVNNFEFFRPLVEALGYPFPKLRLPVSLVYFFAFLTEMVHSAVSRFYNFQPLLTRAEVYKTGVTHYFSIEKARAELGYDPEEYDLGEVVQWFRSRGHSKKPVTSPIKKLILDVLLVLIVVALVLSFLPVVGQ